MKSVVICKKCKRIGCVSKESVGDTEWWFAGMTNDRWFDHMKTHGYKTDDMNLLDYELHIPIEHRNSI